MALGTIAVMPSLLRAQQPEGQVVGQLIRLQQTNDPSLQVGVNALNGDIIRASRNADGTETIVECNKSGQLKYYLGKTPPIQLGTTGVFAIPDLNGTITIQGSVISQVNYAPQNVQQPPSAPVPSFPTTQYTQDGYSLAAKFFGTDPKVLVCYGVAGLGLLLGVIDGLSGGWFSRKIGLRK